MARLQYGKSFAVLQELFESPQGRPLGDALASLPGGFSFLDLGCAPGGFSAFLLSHASCSWGVGVTLPPEVGFPVLIDRALAGVPGRYAVSFGHILEVEASQLATAVGFQRVSLCLCDCQNMRERHGQSRQAPQALRGVRAFLGAYGGASWKLPELSASLEPRVEGLMIWSLIFHQFSLALPMLEAAGGLIFRFSWVLSITDEDVVEEDRGYFEGTMRLFDLLAELFVSVGLFKSTQHHMADSTCYVVCRGFRRHGFDSLSISEAATEHGGVAGAFASSAREVLKFNKMCELPTAACLQLLPDPTLETLRAIRALLEKVTRLREIARMHKGISDGQRFSQVSDAVAIAIGKPLVRHFAEPISLACVLQPLASLSAGQSTHHVATSADADASQHCPTVSSASTDANVPVAVAPSASKSAALTPGASLSVAAAPTATELVDIARGASTAEAGAPTSGAPAGAPAVVVHVRRPSKRYEATVSRGLFAGSGKGAGRGTMRPRHEGSGLRRFKEMEEDEAPPCRGWPTFWLQCGLVLAISLLSRDGATNFLRWRLGYLHGGATNGNATSLLS